jgi:ribosome-dependent ATPase
VFAVPVTGSWLALIVGAFIYLGASTAFGLVVSTLTRTQVAAVFATSVIALVPTSQFSGLLVPVSSLSGAGRAIGLAFPASWFQQISMGTFNKALGFADLWPNHLMLGVFVLGFITAASLILRKQES